MSGAAVYVYGVVGADAVAPDCAGIDAEPLRLIGDDGLAGLVSDVTEEPAFGRAALTAHSDVLEAVLATATVLPMRFGVVMEDDAAVREHLLDCPPRRAARTAGATVWAGRADPARHLRGGALLREILAEEPQIRDMQAATQSAGGGGYLDRMRLGEMIAIAVDARRRS